MTTDQPDINDSLTHQRGVSERSTSSILVIDSGVGGLSICQSILKQQPALQLIYFSDSAYFPYGLMSEDDLSARLKQVVQLMLDKHQPSLVVLACNTVSTLVLPELRSLFPIPFVGVVPAIKPAAAQSQSKRIGLLATPATVKRAYTDQLIQDYAKDCEVVKVGSSELVVLAENLLNDQTVDQEKVNHIISAFKDSQGHPCVDTIVLGCTHFPFLRTYLQQALPEVRWIDSGQAVANRVTFLLDQAGVSSLADQTNIVHQLYFSKPLDHKDAFKQGLTHLGFQSFKLHYLGS